MSCVVGWDQAHQSATAALATTITFASATSNAEVLTVPIFISRGVWAFDDLSLAVAFAGNAAVGVASWAVTVPISFGRNRPEACHFLR